MKVVTPLRFAILALILTASLPADEPSRSARIILFVPDGSAIPAGYETKLQSIAAVAEHFFASEIRRWGWTIERESIFSRTGDDTVEILLARGSIPAGQTGRDALPFIRQAASAVVTNRHGVSATTNDVLWIFYHTPDDEVQGFQGSGGTTGGLAINEYPTAEVPITPGVDLASPDMRELKIKGTMHEFGHGLGLPHIGPKPSENAGNTLMGPINNAYESHLPAGESDTRVYLSEASAAMLAKHPLFAIDPPTAETPAYTISVPELNITEGPAGQFTVSGNVLSDGDPHSAVILDTSDSSTGYWSRPYRAVVSDWGAFSVTVDDPFEQNTGILSLFFAHEDGRNSASGEREVQRGGDKIEISYSGAPGNRIFTPISWSESSSPFDAVLMSGGMTYRLDESGVTLGIDKVTNHRSIGSMSGTLAVQLWATENVFSFGTLSGYKIAETEIGTLNGGASASNIQQAAPLNQPPTGNYNLVFVLTEWNGSSYEIVDHNNLSQRQSFETTVTLPSIAIQPNDSTIGAGGSVAMTVLANGAPDPTYQWFLDDTSIDGATHPTLAFESVQATDAGTYRVSVTNTEGTVTSDTATLTVSSEVNRSTLSNLSVRTTLAATQNLVVGAVVEGGVKSILIRAGGPALNQFGLTGMPDPKMELFDSNQTSTTVNDDWDVSLGDSFDNVGAYAFSNGSKDAALVEQLDGPFTVKVNGTGDGGTVLVEAYDLSGASSPKLVNVSARNKVGTGSDILVAGFVIKGPSPMRVLIRVVGPTLSDFGVTDVLADPILEVFNSENLKILENDNWPASLTPSFSAAGAFLLPIGSNDSAIVAAIPPGTYTVQASGSDGGIGEAIIEIYELD